MSEARLLAFPPAAAPAAERVPCAHCGDFVPAAILRSSPSAGPKFCCEGCAAVASLLRELDLDRDYYGLKAGKRSPLKPVLEPGEDYSALDGAKFRDPSVAHPVIDFFLEGIHCSACVWILEKLPQLSAGIESARLDMGRSILRIQVGPEGRFEAAAQLLLRLGYRPHPMLSEPEIDERIRREDRRTLRRIGISAFAAMNVMIWSVSLYAGVDGREGELFRWLSIATSIPALGYGAWPFYRSAWTALRAGRVSIDLPISLAFVGGFAESLRQALLGTNLLYLDSLTSLVFLILVSRYALSRLERAEVSKSGILHALLPLRAVRYRESDGGWTVERVHPEALREGDLIGVDAGAASPADARVVSGEVWLDLSFLTGESRPARAAAGDPVYAGARVIDGSARARVEARGSETRLGRIQSRLETAAPRKNGRTERSDRWAAIFLASVLGFVALLLALYGGEHPAEAFRRSLSLLIIACPCALALATPLALARAHRVAADRGILLRDPDAIERVLEIRNVAFDKTGTLTLGRPLVRDWGWRSEADRERLESVLYSLESRARHPYGRAIATALENHPGVRLLVLESFREIPGEGVRARFDGSEWFAGRLADQAAGETLVFSRDGRVLAEIALEDALRPESGTVVRSLRERGLDSKILSGDSASAVSAFARRAGIPEWEARLSPEEKRARVKALALRGPVLMIGDGANDALALRAAAVGVAMSRGEGASIETSLAAAEVALLRPDLRALDDLFEIARRYRRTLGRNAVMSATYNLIGASFAAAGLVHPLVGAVAMPIGALTVFLSTVRGIRLPPRKEAA